MATKTPVTAPKGDAATTAQKDLFAGTFTYAVGRRKTSVAQIRLYTIAANAERGHMINGKPLIAFFPEERTQRKVLSPLSVTGMESTYVVSVIVRGGGITGQAEAVRHGVARALIAADAGFRPVLKAAGMLRRDPRAVERKKPGLKKARRATQWRKR